MIETVFILIDSELKLPQWFGPALCQSTLADRRASKCHTLSSTLNLASTTNTVVRQPNRLTQNHLDSKSMPFGRHATTRNVSPACFDHLSIQLTIDLRIWSIRILYPNCRTMPTFDTVHSILLISPAEICQRMREKIIQNLLAFHFICQWTPRVGISNLRRNDDLSNCNWFAPDSPYFSCNVTLWT